MKRKIMFSLVALAGLFAVVSCGPTSSSTSEGPSTRTVTDLMNREVTLKTDIKKAVCIGAGCLRLYSYVADMNMLSGVELIEKTDAPMNLPKRPYQVTYQSLLDSLPQCGLGGPKGQQADTERLLLCNPDVIFSTIKDVEAMDKVTSDTKIPVVIINYGPKGAFELDQDANLLKKSIQLIGTVMNESVRANYVNNMIDGYIKDLNNRTKDIKEEDKPNVYYGALGNFGMHGLDSSQPHYPLLDAVNIKNILDDKGLTNKKEANIDKEILNSIDPDYVFIDAGGINKTTTQINDPDDPLSTIYKGWKAFKENKVFVVLPYKVYYMQIENGILSAYYMGKMIYPEAFKDVDIEAKCKEVFKEFYQVDNYENYLVKSGLKDVAFNNFKYE